MHFVVTCDDEAAIFIPEYVAYIKGIRAIIEFLLEVRGG